MDPIRVFIGTGPGMEPIIDALVCSIISNCSTPKAVEIHLMEAWGQESEWRWWHGQPNPGDADMRGKGYWVTPFSLFRYAIPHVCNFEGYAIYLDADMIVLGDIKRLWDFRQEGKWVTAANRDGDCVSVIDCSAFADDTSYPPFDKLRGGVADKHQLRRLVAPYMVPAIPETWNSHDKVEPNTQLLHFTSIKTQPWQPWPDMVQYEKHPDPKAVECWQEWAEKAKSWQFESA